MKFFYYGNLVYYLLLFLFVYICTTCHISHFALLNRNEGPAPPEPPVTSTQAWAQGLVLLEALQEKKKLINMAEVVPVLFHLLKT